MRVVEHAPRGPHQFLERIHGLAEIVKRGLVVVVELSPAPRRRSVDSSSLRDDTTVVATAARAPTASATRSSSSSKSSSPSADRDCAHYSEASCALFDRFVRARAGVATLRTQLQCCPVLGNETALCPHARGNDSLRMAAARASSSFQTLVNN